MDADGGGRRDDAGGRAGDRTGGRAATPERLTPADAAACEAILRALPDWFGIEEAIVDYRRDVESMETWGVRDKQGIAGFLTVHRHNPASAEIQVMAVRPDRRGCGIGRTLVEWVESRLRADGVALFHVKTLGPSRPDTNYEQTRAFYERMGFVPLEENRLWGSTNPCLMLVKPLGSPAP